MCTPAHKPSMGGIGCRPGVKDPDNGTHVLGCANGRQACYPTPNDQHLGGGDPSSCSDLACEESAKLVGSLNNSPAEGTPL